MTLNQDAATPPTAEQERPADPWPAWERVAYVWLAREVDHGHPVDPIELACEVSVAPGFTRDLLRLLRGHRDRDPGLSELRGRLVRDRIIDAYLRRLRPGDGVLLYGHLRPTPVRLRPYYDPREQARRDRAEDRAARRVARTERRLGRKTERAFKRIQRRQVREQGRGAAARVVWPEREGGRR